MNGRFWEHAEVRAHHLIRMTRSYPDGIAHSVATCQCGWTSTREAVEHLDQDQAIKLHWQSAIAEQQLTDCQQPESER